MTAYLEATPCRSMRQFLSKSIDFLHQLDQPGLILMPTLTVRQLEDDLYQDLKAQAESHGRSMESEVAQGNREPERRRTADLP